MVNDLIAMMRAKQEFILMRIAIVAAFAFFFATIGPFGEYVEDPFTVRLRFWVFDMTVGAIIFLSCFHAVSFWGKRSNLPAVTVIVLAAFFGALPMIAFLEFTELLAGRPMLPDIKGWTSQYFETTVIAIVVLSAFHLADTYTGKIKPEPAAALLLEKRNASASFIERLSPALGDDLLYLKMEDHYVRAHTSNGNQLIHMRLADAVDELSASPGFQPHRSWWVSAASVDRIVKSGGQVFLIINDGKRIPVARRRLKDLREVGWINE